MEWKRNDTRGMVFIYKTIPRSTHEKVASRGGVEGVNDKVGIGS